MSSRRADREEGGGAIEPHAEPNRQRNHHWWAMYVNARRAVERVRWNQPGPASWYAKEAVHEAHLMLAIPKLPEPPIPACSICLSDNCKHDHVCE